MLPLQVGVAFNFETGSNLFRLARGGSGVRGLVSVQYVLRFLVVQV
jgi:hypothetical protein